MRFNLNRKRHCKGANSSKRRTTDFWGWSYRHQIMCTWLSRTLTVRVERGKESATLVMEGQLTQGLERQLTQGLQD